MLYTPLLPEAASGTLEPRHVVVPLRVMCPHAELLLGRAGALDRGADVAVETDRRHRSTSATSASCWRSARSPRAVPVPGLAEHGLGFKSLAGRDRAAQPRARSGSRPRRGRTTRSAPASSASCSSAPATRASRRSPSSPTSSTTRSRYYPRAARRAAALGARRRGADRSCPRSRPARRLRRARARAARRRDPRRHDARRRRRRRGRALRRDARSRRARSSGRRASGRTRCSRELGLPLDERGRVRVDELLRVEGQRRRLGARRLRARAERGDARRARPADLPARAPPGAPAREEPRRATRSRTATGCSGRWRRSAATRGSPTCSGFALRGFPGWFVARTYHLYQLPLAAAGSSGSSSTGRSRCSSAATSPSSSMLGHPEGLEP